VGPAIDLAVGVDVIVAVEIAAHGRGVLLPGCSIFLQEVDRKEDAAPQADKQAALFERPPNSRYNCFQDPRHDPIPADESKVLYPVRIADDPEATAGSS